MALSVGKIAILAGAGILGSVLIKEDRVSNVTDFVSGAFKIFKQLGGGGSSSSGKSKNDYLKEQIDKIRLELQNAVPNRPESIYIYSRSSGARGYGVSIIVVVVAGGCGYIWWKGWKLSDFMFATRRSLSDACLSVAKQLDHVSSSISAAKRHLSSRIDRVDCNIDECAELTLATKSEVSELRGDLSVFSMDMKSVQLAVQTLETKIGRIDGKQDKTIDGVRVLCNFVQNLETSRTAASIQASPSRPALELPQITPTSRTVSLPQPLSQNPPSVSSSNESPKGARPLHSSASTSGIEIQGISDMITAVTGSEVVPNGQSAENSKELGSSSSGRFGWILGRNPSILSRNISATASFKLQG